MVPNNRWAGDDESVRISAESLAGQRTSLIQKNRRTQDSIIHARHLSKMSQMKLESSYAGWSYSGVSITHVADQAERISELF